MITNSRVESELKVSWTWANHSKAFSHCFSLTLAVSLIFYNFWQICGCFSYCDNWEYITLPLYPQHLLKWRVSRESNWGTASPTAVEASCAHPHFVKTHTNPSMLAAESRQACCDWHKHNHLDTTQLSTQATMPGPLTSHRTADNPVHRSLSSSHSALAGELGSCHPLGLLCVWEVVDIGAPAPPCIWCKRLIRLHQHFLQTLPVRSPQPLPAVPPERALWRREVTTAPWKRSQEEKGPEQRENRERWAGQDFKRATGSELSVTL